jgi:hypothetical protein
MTTQLFNFINSIRVYLVSICYAEIILSIDKIILSAGGNKTKLVRIAENLEKLMNLNE